MRLMNNSPKISVCIIAKNEKQFIRNFMKRLTLIFAMIFSALSLQAQTEQTDTIDAIAIVPMPKHEFGFTVGAFPLVGPIPPAEKYNGLFGDSWFFRLISGPEYGPEHYSYEKDKNGSYEKMYHLGSYALSYHYHNHSNISRGVSLSWVGRHIDKYDWIGNDTINGSGWKHCFTLQYSYRNTYSRKNNISLYMGFYFGTTLSVRDKNILYKRIHKVGTGGGGWISFTRTVSNERIYFDWAAHITAFGINIGTKNILNMELGIGTLGILRAGYKYKF